MVSEELAAKDFPEIYKNNKEQYYKDSYLFHSDDSIGRSGLGDGKIAEKYSRGRAGTVNHPSSKINTLPSNWLLKMKDGDELYMGGCIIDIPDVAKYVPFDINPNEYEIIKKHPCNPCPNNNNDGTRCVANWTESRLGHGFMPYIKRKQNLGDKTTCCLRENETYPFIETIDGVSINETIPYTVDDKNIKSKCPTLNSENCNPAMIKNCIENNGNTINYDGECKIWIDKNKNQSSVKDKILTKCKDEKGGLPCAFLSPNELDDNIINNNVKNNCFKNNLIYSGECEKYINDTLLKNNKSLIIPMLETCKIFPGSPTCSKLLNKIRTDPNISNEIKKLPDNIIINYCNANISATECACLSQSSKVNNIDDKHKNCILSDCKSSSDNIFIPFSYFEFNKECKPDNKCLFINDAFQNESECQQFIINKPPQSLTTPPSTTPQPEENLSFLEKFKNYYKNDETKTVAITTTVIVSIICVLIIIGIIYLIIK